MSDSYLSVQELRRYKNQILLPRFGVHGQEKLKKSRVIVIGAGGTGSSTLQYLAVSGIGEIGICDNTIIEEENFQNQVLFNGLDLGKHMAIITKTKLEAINTFNKYTIYNVFLSAENVFDICGNFDIVINSTNNEQIGILLDEACFQLQIPLIFTLKIESCIDVTVFNYNKGPRLSDYLNSKLKSGISNENQFPKGSFGPIYGLVGNYMALEALKIISGIGEVLSGKYLSLDPLNLVSEYKKF